MLTNPLHAVLYHVRRRMRMDAANAGDASCFGRSPLCVTNPHSAFCCGGPRCLQSAVACSETSTTLKMCSSATSLVLARKAGPLPWQQSIGPWLHEVAYRLAEGLPDRFCWAD